METSVFIFASKREILKNNQNFEKTIEGNW